MRLALIEAGATVALSWSPDLEVLLQVLRSHDVLSWLGFIQTYNILASANYESSQIIYRTRAIISRGLYIFYPIFKDHFFVFKEVF